MATSSEDVLLMINHVRHKKSDGTLYLMAERIAWMLEGKDTFSISHKYIDVKMQKVSPEGKSKIQLQVVLHNSETTTFHFVNPLGAESQTKDRNDVKEMLQQLLPKFKIKVNKELEEKNRILQDDPELLQLYKDLVVTQIISADEFWANYAAKKQKANGHAVVQDVGVSAAFLADIKPQTDGCNGLKYNITPEIIEAIFQTYPAVRKKHFENVPNKLTEREFWTRFFQSHYFHRDRLNSGSKDLFSECAKSDEQDIKTALKKIEENPLLDIQSFDDQGQEEPSSSSSLQSKQSSVSSANQSMIRRFNHHSMMILQTSQLKRSVLLEEPSSKPSLPHPLPNGAINSKPSAVENSQSNQEVPNAKKAKLEEKTTYEDLVDVPSTSGIALNLAKADRYLQGPVPPKSFDYPTTEEIFQANHYLQYEISNWKPDFVNVLQPNLAISALGELSPGGILMKNSDQVPLKDTLPSDLQLELKSLYSTVGELLRHFWLCFPTTTPSLEEKVTRMRDTLERFQFAKLQPFKDKLYRDHYNPKLTIPLSNMLQAAYNKYSNWQSRRISFGKK